jgi:polyisoprenoid-binding protein YceI
LIGTGLTAGASARRRRETVGLIIPGGDTMGRLLKLLAMVPLTLLTASSAWATTYVIDPDHTSIVLNTTHLGIGTVHGRFDKFAGTFEYDPNDVVASRVSVRIDASSINTNQPVRDRHLRSADFLDVKRFPEIIFTSTAVTRIDRDEFRILGDLSMHGVTHPVTLLTTLGGTAADADGKSRIAFSARTEIYRKDFDLHPNRVVGLGARLVGEMIRIILEVEGVEQTPDFD